MKINLYLQKLLKKQSKYLASIEITEDELSKHSMQRLSLLLNKMTEYSLKNAKRDDLLVEFLNHIDKIEFLTDDCLRVDVVNRGSR